MQSFTQIFICGTRNSFFEIEYRNSFEDIHWPFSSMPRWFFRKKLRAMFLKVPKSIIWFSICVHIKNVQQLTINFLKRAICFVVHPRSTTEIEWLESLALGGIQTYELRSILLMRHAVYCYATTTAQNERVKCWHVGFILWSISQREGNQGTGILHYLVLSVQNAIDYRYNSARCSLSH